MTSKRVQVPGIAMFASVHTPNKHTEVFSVDLVVDKKTEEELTALGLSPAKNKDGELVTHPPHAGKVFRFKRKTVTKSGKQLDPPQVVDSQGNAIPKSTLIGNGSKVVLHGSAYEYRLPSGKSGIAGGLNALQVVELVTFNRFETVEGGFTISDTTSENTTTTEETLTTRTKLGGDPIA